MEILQAAHSWRRSSESPRHTCALVLENDGACRRELTRCLERLGYTVISASTPLEAIVRLSMSHFVVDVAFIAPSISGTRGAEFAEFLVDWFPGVRLVLLARGGRERLAQPPWEPNPAHGILLVPWTWRSLVRVLHPAGRAERSPVLDRH